MTDPQFSSYEQFFAFYLEQHSNAANRLLHACGTPARLRRAGDGYRHAPLHLGAAVDSYWVRFRLDRTFPDRGQQTGDLRTSVVVVHQRFPYAWVDADRKIETPVLPPLRL
jgi:Protein of unknown function (DUF962)